MLRDPVTFSIAKSPDARQVPLSAGGLFPDAVTVTAYTEEGLMTFDLGVEEGLVVLNRFVVERPGKWERTERGDELIRWGPEITPETVHKLPLARLLKRVIETVGMASAQQGLTPVQAARARRRGFDLERVAEIVRSDTSGAYRQVVADEFDVSDRTASRLIAKARTEGLL